MPKRFPQEFPATKQRSPRVGGPQDKAMSSETHGKLVDCCLELTKAVAGGKGRAKI